MSPVMMFYVQKDLIITTSVIVLVPGMDLTVRLTSMNVMPALVEPSK